MGCLGTGLLILGILALFQDCAAGALMIIAGCFCLMVGKK